jgi:glycerophosphoryl diester phosphodiesterase
MNTCILAHRGASILAPENTAASFQLAIDMGVDGVEFDVQMTKDEELVIIHDEKVDRTTNGKGYIKDFTLQEMKALDAGMSFSEKYKGEKILTLEEALEIVKECDMINIELKNGLIQYPDLEKKVISIVRSYKLDKKVLLSSFNHYSIHKISKIAPDIMTGILYGEILYNPWDYARYVGSNAINPHYLCISGEIIKQSHKNGIKVHVYTVNNEEDITKMINEGVDTIITDYPERAISLIKKYCMQSEHDHHKKIGR